MAEYLVHSPEHVAIRLQPAGLGRRLAAFVVDAVILIAAISAINGLLDKLPQSIAMLAQALVGFLIMWGYHVYFEARHAGQSPGKRMARLRVVDGRGLPVDLRQSLLRNLARILDVLPAGGIGMLCCLIDRHHRRLGDLLADTLVVEDHNDRIADLHGLTARRQNSLDSAKMRRVIAHRISLEEREFLLDLCLRAQPLSENARYRIFETVGDHYRERLGIDQQQLSGENLVRNLVALCFERRSGD